MVKVKERKCLPVTVRQGEPGTPQYHNSPKSNDNPVDHWKTPKNVFLTPPTQCRWMLFVLLGCTYTYGYHPMYPNTALSISAGRVIMLIPHITSYDPRLNILAVRALTDTHTTQTGRTLDSCRRQKVDVVKPFQFYFYTFKGHSKFICCFS